MRKKSVFKTMLLIILLATSRTNVFCQNGPTSGNAKSVHALLNIIQIIGYDFKRFDYTLDIQYIDYKGVKQNRSIGDIKMKTPGGSFYAKPISMNLGETRGSLSVTKKVDYTYIFTRYDTGHIGDGQGRCVMSAISDPKNVSDYVAWKSRVTVQILDISEGGQPDCNKSGDGGPKPGSITPPIKPEQQP